MPRTFIGWGILIIVLLIFFVGWAGAGQDVHSWITGVDTFGHAVAGR